MNTDLVFIRVAVALIWFSITKAMAAKFLT